MFRHVGLGSPLDSNDQMSGLLMPGHKPRVMIMSSFLNYCHWLRPFRLLLLSTGVRGGAVGWGTVLQAGGSRIRRPVRRADNLTTFIFRLSWNLRASTSWNPMGLSRPVVWWLYHYLLPITIKLILCSPTKDRQQNNPLHMIDDFLANSMTS
jgi:hypothetical protein